MSILDRFQIHAMHFQNNQKDTLRCIIFSIWRKALTKVVQPIMKSNYSVYDGGCTYTHLLHAHFSAHGACTVISAHLHACHTHMAQVREKGVCRMSVFVLHLAFSILMCHPSFAVSVRRLFLSLDFPVHTFLPCLPVVKAQGTRISARAPRSLATWPNLVSTHQEEDGKTTSTNSSNLKRMRPRTPLKSDNECNKSWIKAAKDRGRWTLLENDYRMTTEERSESNARHRRNTRSRPARYVNGMRLSDDEVANIT